MHIHLPKPHLHLHKPREGWLKAKAVIESVEWFEPAREQFGYYDVTYAYAVGDAVHRGRFHDYAHESEECLKISDVIEILYNPGSCIDCHYPDVRTLASRKMMYIGMGVAAGPRCC